MSDHCCPIAAVLPLKRGDLRDALVTYARVETDNGRIDAMSLRAAARDLGVSSGAVYRHFCDKDELLKAVAHQGFMDMRQIFFAIRPEGAVAPSAEVAVARAFELGRKFVRFAFDNPSLWRMMFGRIGVMCRADHMNDKDLMRYTLMDVCWENCRDIHRHGGMAEEPTVEDVRFMWSAIHGAADLAQSGARLDGEQIDCVANQTTERSLRAIRCREEVIRNCQSGQGTEF